MSQNVNIKNKVQKTKLKKVHKTKVVVGASLSKKEKKTGYIITAMNCYTRNR